MTMAHGERVGTVADGDTPLMRPIHVKDRSRCGVRPRRRVVARVQPAYREGGARALATLTVAGPESILHRSGCGCICRDLRCPGVVDVQRDQNDLRMTRGPDGQVTPRTSLDAL